MLYSLCNQIICYFDLLIPLSPIILTSLLGLHFLLRDLVSEKKVNVKFSYIKRKKSVMSFLSIDR